MSCKQMYLEESMLLIKYDYISHIVFSQITTYLVQYLKIILQDISYYLYMYCMYIIAVPILYKVSKCMTCKKALVKINVQCELKFIICNILHWFV